MIIIINYNNNYNNNKKKKFSILLVLCCAFLQYNKNVDHFSGYYIIVNLLIKSHYHDVKDLL